MVSTSIDIDPLVKSRLSGFNIAFASYQDVNVGSSSSELAQELSEEEDKTRKSLDLESMRLDPGIIESRRGFKALGVDPARYRPSQEALLRRIIKGESLYQINTGVDVCNLLSVRFRVPMGLYDSDKIEGSPRLRIGSSQDIYMALNGREVQCEDKLILCDERGVLGSPYVDSQRSSVTPKTRNFFHVIYFCYADLAQNNLMKIKEIILKYHNGTAENYAIIKI